jgi:hypothetical protein
MQLALGIVPQIVEVVKAIEVPGRGTEKLGVITALLQAAFDVLPDGLKAQIEANKIASFAVTVTRIVVDYLNATGVFARSAPKPAVPAGR